MGLGSEAISFLLLHLAFPSGWMSWSTLWCAFLVIWVTELEKCSFSYTYFQSQCSGSWRNGSAVKDTCHDSRRTGLEFSINVHKRGGERGSIPIISVSKVWELGINPQSRLAIETSSGFNWEILFQYMCENTWKNMHIYTICTPKWTAHTHGQWRKATKLQCLET